MFAAAVSTVQDFQIAQAVAVIGIFVLMLADRLRPR